MYRNRLTGLGLSVKQRTRITPTDLSPLEEAFGLSYATYTRCNMPGRYIRVLGNYSSNYARAWVSKKRSCVDISIYVSDHARQHDRHHSLRAI